MRSYLITGASKGIGHATAVDLGDQVARTPVIEDLAQRYEIDGILSTSSLVTAGVPSGPATPRPRRR